MNINEAIIKVEGLCKKYSLYRKPIDRLLEALNPWKKKYHEDFYALHDVSFEIKRGETIGIVGRNGSGKSTLLKILTGVLFPSEGKVMVEGKISALLELGAGFNPDFTGMENIYLNGTIMGYSRSEMDERLEAILSFADIGDFIYQPVKVYSSGMFVRLAFAVAINVDPDILIVDEALAVGDVRFQIKCMDKFQEFRERGKTILFVSHDLSSVKKFCSRALWLNNGKIELIGETNFVTDRYIDFLRGLDKPVVKAEKTEKSALGWIEQITILNARNEEIEEVSYLEKVSIKVDYHIIDDTIKDIVIGIALFRKDGLYVCGLNTFLDQYHCDWKKGANTIFLEYEAVNLLGGEYYLDAAIFERLAHIPIEYRSQIKKFCICSPYEGEGVCILTHRWKKEI